jgi:hypothetical protein
MKHFIILFVVCLSFLITGCSQLENTSPVSPQFENLQLDKAPVPFKARVESQAVVTPISWSPYHMSAVLTGTGNSTLMGKIEFAASHENGIYDIRDGIFETTAANGDKIFGTYVGMFDLTTLPLEVGLNMDMIITGGTGRFTGATGTLEGMGGMDPVTKVSWMEISGYLNK